MTLPAAVATDRLTVRSAVSPARLLYQKIRRLVRIVGGLL